MFRIVFIWLLMLTAQITFSQERENITIDFVAVNRIQAIESLEKVIDYKFYFEAPWFDDSTITESFKNESLNVILEEMLKGTPINFLVFDGKIILTKNNAIIDQLPSGVNTSVQSKESNNIVVTTNKTPVFQKQYRSRKFISKEVIPIGKEVKNTTKTKVVVSGYVKDASSGKPIENLVLFVKNRNINTTTDISGFYTLELPLGLNVLETSSLSYGKTSRRLLIYGEGSLDFDLIESAEFLDAVLIESDKDDNIRKAEVGVTKIEVESIKTIPLVLGERDVLKVATTMPGIKTAGEGALGYNVRGGKVDQNLILFDGATMYNPSHFFGVFSAINPFAAGSVNIYKGNIPAEFGGRLSSVIDISTKEPNNEKISGEGNIGPVTGNLMLEVPVIEGKAAIMAGVRATYSDWVLKAVSEESIKDSKANFYDAVLKYNHKINDKNNLQATGYFSKDQFSVTSDSIYEYSNRLASVKWDHEFDRKNRASLQLASSEYKFNIVYDGDFNRNFDYGYNINETQLKLNAKYLHSKKHKFGYGFSSKFYSIKPGRIEPLGNESVIESQTIDQEKALESAIFISDLLEVNKKLLLDIGLRYSFYAALGASSQNVYDASQPKSEESIVEVKTYDKNEVIKTYGGPEYRISARYELKPDLSIKGGYNKTIQYSHLLSTNSTASPVDSWKLSDLNIKPQRAQQFSLGLFKNFSEGLYELSLEGYYKKMNNLLDFKTGAQVFLNEDIETELLQGEGKAYGAELLLKKEKGKINGWIGYSYSRSFVKLDSDVLSNQVNGGDYFSANQDRPHDLSIVSNYRLTKRYSFSLNFNYQTGRPITYPIGKYDYNGSEHVLYSDRNAHRIPDYYRLDLGVNIEGNHKNVKLAHSFWNISVYNVLGRNNPYSVFFVNDSGEIKAYQSSIFSIPVPTITYNFKF